MSQSVGSGLVQGILIGPDGLTYVATEPFVSRIDRNNNVEIYAGLNSKGYRDGPRLQAQFNFIRGMRFMNNLLLLCDASDHKIRAVNQKTDLVETFAGSTRGRQDGPKLEARFNWPTDIIVFQGMIFIADMSNSMVRVISPEGMVSSIGLGLQEGGSRLSTTFDSSWDSCRISHATAFAIASGRLFVTDDDENFGSIREITLQPEKTVKTLVKLNSSAFGICDTPDGDLVVTDADAGSIYHVPITGNGITTLISKKVPASPHPHFTAYSLKTPTFTCVDPVYGHLWWSESSSNRVAYVPFMFSSSWSLESLLESQAQSDISFTHSPSQESFNLNSEVIKLLIPAFTPDLVANLGQLDIPIQNLKLAISLIYGSLDAQRRLLDNNPLEIAHVCAVFKALGAGPEEKCQKWLRSQFYHHVSQISKLSDIFNLLSSLVTSSSYSQFSELVQITVAVGKQLSSPAQLASIQGHHEPEVFQKTESLLNSPAPSISDMKLDAAYDHPLKLQQDRGLDLANSLQWVSRPASASSDSQQLPLRFKLSIQGFDKDIEVLSWMLYARWPYFRTMLESGLEESRSGRMELPSDFPPVLLLEIIKYIYSNQVRSTIVFQENAEYLQANGGQFGFVQLDGTPAPHFERIAFWKA
jgi:hypothetical protein